MEEAAAAAGRSIDDEHYGALVLYSRTPGALPDRLAALLAARSPGADPTDVVPSGHAALRTHLERFVEVGFSKFVVVPVGDPPDWDDELGRLAETVLPLQN